MALLGCEQAPPPPAAPAERAVALPAAPGAPPAPSAAPSAPPAPRRILCAQQLGKPGRDAPRSKASRAGQGSLPDQPTYGGGRWTWVNLWAAWCVPCKEEIPRLRAWEAELAGERAPLRLVFVSLDDDERQLQATLATVPPLLPGGSTYWLRDGKERQDWLKEAGFSDEPELPAHLLVDPSGTVRCTVRGAVEDADRPELVKILRGLRGGTGAGRAKGASSHGHN